MHSRAAVPVENKMVTMQHKIFAFVSSLKLSRRLLCSVCFFFVSTFNLHRGWNTATNCLACVEAPFTLQLSPSFLIILFNTENQRDSDVSQIGKVCFFALISTMITFFCFVCYVQLKLLKASYLFRKLMCFTNVNAL